MKALKRRCEPFWWLFLAALCVPQEALMMRMGVTDALYMHRLYWDGVGY